MKALSFVKRKHVSTSATRHSVRRQRQQFGLRLECLEPRLVLAGWSNASASAHYQDITESDAQRGRILAAAQAIAVEDTTAAFAYANAPNQFQARSVAGGSALDPNARSHLAESSTSISASRSWIVRGATLGDSTNVSVTLIANGLLGTHVDGGSTDGTLRSRVRVNLRHDQTTLIDTQTEVNNGLLTPGAHWIHGQQPDGQFGVRYVNTVTFSVIVGTSFNMNAVLDTYTLANPLPDAYASADFTGTGGLRFSMESSLPGTSVFEFRPLGDSDRDGVPDAVEDGGPSQGDGDGNANADKLQSTVATLSDSAGNYFTLQLEDGMGNPVRGTTQFEYVGPSTRQSPNSGSVIGPFDVIISGLTSTPDAFLRIIPHTTVETPMHYYQFGPDATDPNPHWFDFPFDGNVGATIQAGQSDLRVQLTDGHIPGDSPAGTDSKIQFTAALVYDNNVNLVPWSGDTDQDRIADQIEDQAPFGGDANRDGTPDKLQGHVASFLDDKNYFITLELLNRRSPSTRFSNVGLFTVPVPERMTQHAVFQAEIIDAPANASHSINIIRPPTTGYLHYGKELNAPYDHWFEYPFDGRVGSTRTNLSVTLQLADNETGDRDPTVGTIGFAGAAGILNRLQIQQYAETYLDANRNGIRDQGEAPLVGQPIYVDENFSGSADPEEPVFFTDSTGQARITGLELETYAIGHATTPGMLQTQPSLFHTATSTSDVGTARTLTTADLNNDGYGDLVVPNDNMTVILLNQGDGSFVESDRLIGLFGHDESAAVGDFNSDSVPDIAVTYTLSDRVGVWFGNGDGTFQFAQNYDANNSPNSEVSPYAIRSADVSGDGNEDLVVVSYEGVVSTFFGQSDGSFLGPQTNLASALPGTTDSTIADLDGDGHLDIVVTNPREDILTILYNDGPLQFPDRAVNFTTTTLPITGGAVATGQFNSGFAGDQFLDLAIGQSGRVLILYGNAMGQFDLARSQHIIVPDGASALAALDFDLDGHTDLAAVGTLSDKLTLLKQGEATINFVLKSTLIPVSTMDVSQFPVDIKAEDLDGDTHLDLAVAANRGHTIDILRGNPYQQHIVHMGERPIGRNSQISFGVYPLESGSIEGRIWTDLDADGVRDVNSPACPNCAEPYREGVTVYLDQNQNGRLDIRTEAFVQTDVNGRYRFIAVEAGTYPIRMDLEPAAAQSFPATLRTIRVNKNQTVSGVDFGYAPPSLIEGTVFYDSNLNGNINAGEERLADWLVFIDEDNDNEFDSGESFVRTDSSGFYSFPLTAGSYKITQSIPVGWDDSFPRSSVVDITQSDRRTLNFANHPDTGSISGVKWNDRNGNGIYELREGIPGVEVYVDLNHNGANDNEPSGMTDADGRYQIDGIPVGDHIVREFDAIEYANRTGDSSFGFSAAANDDLVLIGAPTARRRNEDGIMAEEGRVLVYDRMTGGTVGELEPPRFPPGSINVPNLLDAFGANVAIAANGEARVTAPYYTGGVDFIDNLGAVVRYDAQQQRVGVLIYDRSSWRGWGGPYDATGIVSSTGITAVDNGWVVADGLVLEFFWPRRTRQVEGIGAAVVGHADGVAASVVGRPGAPFYSTVFLYDTLGNQEAQFHNPEFGSAFGTSLSLDGTKLLVGAPTATGAGAAYVYDKSSHQLLHRLSNPGNSGQFGISVLAIDDQILVGDGQGYVHVFDADSGDLIESITNPVLGVNTGFGYTLAPSADGLFIVTAVGRSTLEAGQAFLMSPGQRVTVVKDMTATVDFAQSWAGPDRDFDRVFDVIEDGAPNNGDGNNDGVRDRHQLHVTSLPNPIDGSYLTVVSADGTQLENVTVTANPDPANSPPGVQFPFGFVSFELSGLTPGEHTSVRIITHGAATPTAFYKYGRTPLNNTKHFYRFNAGPSANCVSNPNCVGAHIDGNGVTLFLTDGFAGDSDLTANGRIVDPGAMAIEVPGDSNHDGVFDSSDLIAVFVAGKYEDEIPNNATFEEGDWNGDGEFDTADLVFAFQAGTYVAMAMAREIPLPDLDILWEGKRKRTGIGHPVMEHHEVIDETFAEAVGELFYKTR